METCKYYRPTNTGTGNHDSLYFTLLSASVQYTFELIFIAWYYAVVELLGSYIKKIIQNSPETSIFFSNSEILIWAYLILDICNLSKIMISSFKLQAYFLF